MTVPEKTFGLALGGGGVRGLAHVPAYEAMEACGIRPSALTGTSMGAILGTLFASGASGREVRAFVEENFAPRATGFRQFCARQGALLKIAKSVTPSWGKTGLFKADRFLRYLTGQMGVSRFEDLEIPLRVVATDFHTGEAVVFDSGPLFPALKASMAIPGAFVPLKHRGRILVDGGMSNNLPYTELPDACEVTIAVDVSPTREAEEGKAPNVLDATLGMFDILVDHQTKCMIRDNPPTVYFHPALTGIRVLEFDKIDEVFHQTERELEGFKARLEAVLASG